VPIGEDAVAGFIVPVSTRAHPRGSPACCVVEVAIEIWLLSISVFGSGRGMRPADAASRAVVDPQDRAIPPPYAPAEAEAFALSPASLPGGLCPRADDRAAPRPPGCPRSRSRPARHPWAWSKAPGGRSSRECFEADALAHGPAWPPQRSITTRAPGPRRCSTCTSTIEWAGIRARPAPRSRVSHPNPSTGHRHSEPRGRLARWAGGASLGTWRRLVAARHAARPRSPAMIHSRSMTDQVMIPVRRAAIECRQLQVIAFERRQLYEPRIAIIAT